MTTMSMMFCFFSFNNFDATTIIVRIFSFKYLFFNNVWWKYCVLTSLSLEKKSWIRLIKLLNLIFCLFERYVIWKLNSKKNSIHLIWRRFNCLKIIKCFKLRWSFSTFIEFSIDVFAHFDFHFSNALIMINNFLSYIS